MQKLYAKKCALPSVMFLRCQDGCLFIPLDFSFPAFTLLHTEEIQFRLTQSSINQLWELECLNFLATRCIT